MHLLNRMIPHITITHPEQISRIIHAFLNRLFKVTTNNLISNHNPCSIPLLQLKSDQSFSTYSMSPNALFESFDFECERLLVNCLPFAEYSLECVQLLKGTLQKLPLTTTNCILEQLVENLFSYEH